MSVAIAPGIRQRMANTWKIPSYATAKFLFLEEYVEDILLGARCSSCSITIIVLIYLHL
jgi:hypothetical protein